jgi:hypothetical protein
VAVWLNRLDWMMVLTRYTAIHNAAILLCLLWMLMVPDSPTGLLGLLQVDVGLRRNAVIALVMAIFFMDVAQALRGLTPNWSFLTTLSGQCVMAIIATVYTLRGSIGLVGFYTYVGPFALSVIGLMVAIQRAHLRPPWFVPRWVRENTKHAMLTSISVLLWILAWGLMTRPDATVARSIQSRYGLGFFIAMVGVILWGAGQLRHNHMKPWWALRRMLGIYLYSLMVMYAIAADNSSISPLSVYLSVSIAVLSVFFALIQAQDQSVGAG